MNPRAKKNHEYNIIKNQIKKRWYKWEDIKK